MHETSAEDGNAMIAVFYRSERITPDALALATVKVHVFNNALSWD
jgi:hypothetical protein